MAGTTGITHASVKAPPRDGSLEQQLFASPSAFSFIQAVRILYHAHGKGRRILDFLREDVRVRPQLSLGFPPSDIVSLERLRPEGKGPRFRLTVSMLGLYGASSPLPTFYTEELLAEEAEDREALRAFLDVINDALYGHFLHAGWLRYRVQLAASEQQNHTLRESFYAPAGLSDPAIQGFLEHRHGILPLIAGLSQFPRSAAGLQAFLAGCLGVPIRVEQCVPRKARVPEDQQCRLGHGHKLGESAILGSEALDLNGTIAIHIGPLDRRTLVRFCPGTEDHEGLIRLASFYCTEPLRFELQLELDAANREPAEGGPGSLVLGALPYGRLGRDAWLSLTEGETGRASFPAVAMSGSGQHGSPQKEYA